MPVYDYRCPRGHIFDVVKKIAQLDQAEHCPDCGSAAQRQIALPMIAKDYEGYVSPATGKWIEGKKAHLEDLKRSGCRLYEAGETEAYIKGLPAYRKSTEKVIDEAVELAARDIGLGR